MASSVFFKFKSQKEPTRVVFDGTGISVFELKREIILRSGLGDGTEFDLHIYADESMKEVYDDDTTVIPRSTTVIARRIPAKVQGRGGAARYVTGKMPIHAKNSSRREQISKPTTKTQSNTLAQLSSAMTEEEKMAAVFQAQTENFTSREEEMATQQYVAKGGPKKPANVPDHEPPQGYVCYRCGEKGHWIQLCPTNDNPEYDNRPRIKRTTGIPKSFLKTVDRASAMAQNEEGDEAKRPTGLMVTLEGEYVIAEPDKASWEQFQAKAKSNNTVQKTASEEDKRMQELGLDCPIDNKMFIEPMKTPCCEKTYCNDCITNALIESDFVCPACKTEGVLIDDLKTDEEAVEKIKKFLAEKDSKPKEAPKSPASASKQRRTASPRPAKVKPRKSASPSPAPAASTRPAKSATPTPSNRSATSTPADGESTSQNLKKRPAEEPLENPKIPKAPKAMQKAQGTQQQQGVSGQMMGGMNNPMLRGGAMPGFQGGMPNMMYPGMPMMGTFGGGMGMPNMGMGMMNPMMNPMMAGGMGPGFPGDMPNMNGGFQGGLTGNGMWGGPHNGMGGLNPNMGGGMNGNNMIQHGGPVGGYNNPAGGFQQQPPQMMMNHPQMQQQQQHNMMMPHKQFGYQVAGDDEDAYFRKPVNPHRHQNRQRRVRPSDYREL